MIEDNSEYILNITEMLLIELSHDAMISVDELKSKVSAIMMLMPSKNESEKLIFNLEMKDQENSGFKNYQKILKIIKNYCECTGV